MRNKLKKIEKNVTKEKQKKKKGKNASKCLEI